jgi:hypothetical protein
MDEYRGQQAGVLACDHCGARDDARTGLCNQRACMYWWCRRCGHEIASVRTLGCPACYGVDFYPRPRAARERTHRPRHRAGSRRTKREAR